MGKTAKKSSYKIKNWSEYNQALVNRGSLTIWIDEEWLSEWKDARPAQQGAQYDYSDKAIETMLTLRYLFKLPLRATQGFGQSLFALMEVDLNVPHYSTLSRRAKSLSIEITDSSKPVRTIILDSTGLKVYGEGEWKVRKHGYSKRRTWRKLHVGIDEETQQLIMVQLTPNGVGDSQAGKELLEAVSDKSIDTVRGDGGYDSREIYQLCETQEIDNVVIPPQKNAKIWQHGNCKGHPHPRDENLRYIRKHGRAKWKRESGYHQRSLVETAMYRFKITFGATLAGRLMETQQCEVMIKSKILNRFTQQGLPESYAIG